jgi:cell division protein FtsI/penicillin-binding protein 2
MGFAKKGQSIISISIIVEHGGTGGEIAAPLAKIIVESFYSKPELTLK